MRSADRLIVIGLPLVALAVGFWFLALQPKREQASELGERIESAGASIASAERQIAAARAARAEFPANYAELVKLGRAVPEDGDQATLLYDLSALADRKRVSFRDFKLLSGGTGGEPAAPEPPPPPPPSGAEQEGEDQGDEGDDRGAEPEDATDDPVPVTAPTPAPATEASAALLPIGATVGPAGLPTLPYSFKFLGGFFEIADFFAAIDDQVEVRGGGAKVGGRLLTIDGFALSEHSFKGFPRVEANFSVTSYVVPAEQGLLAGATPSGPPPVAPAGSEPVSNPNPGGVAP